MMQSKFGLFAYPAEQKSGGIKWKIAIASATKFDESMMEIDGNYDTEAEANEAIAGWRAKHGNEVARESWRRSLAAKTSARRDGRSAA